MTAGDTHLQARIAQLESLAPSFGRATKDIHAICSRARSEDYRGVLQNTRLVVETLLRAIYAKKKQTPGKQTLEQLLQKMQPDLPTNIQVHARTIQAWGNVGAHDHSDELFGDHVEFTKEEALASLHSLVVILEWFRAQHLDDASIPSVPAIAAMPAVAPAPPPAEGRSKTTLVVAIGVVAAASLAVFAIPRGVDREALDRTYVEAKIPPPPEACRTDDSEAVRRLTDAMQLLADGRAHGARPADERARSLLEEQVEGPEGWGVLARARLFASADAADVLAAVERTTEVCGEWAEPHNLKGNLHIFQGELAAARSAYERASQLAPGYLAPKFNLGLVHLKKGDVEAAVAQFDAVLAGDPDYAIAYGARGRAYLLSERTDDAITDLEEALRRDPKDGASAMVLGQAYRASGDEEKANEAFCRAERLGVEAATCRD